MEKKVKIWMLAYMLIREYVTAQGSIKGKRPTRRKLKN